jgi:hypothetical protein
MKLTNKWTFVIGGATIGSLLLLAFVGLSFSRLWSVLYPIRAGHGMMRDGFSHYSSVSGSPLGWLALAAVILLLIVAGIWMASQNAPKSEGVPTGRNPDEPLVCPGCGQDVQSNWNLCPYCGYELPLSAQG